MATKIVLYSLKFSVSYQCVKRLFFCTHQNVYRVTMKKEASGSTETSVRIDTVSYHVT